MFGKSLFSIITGLALLIVALMDLTGCGSSSGNSKNVGTPGDQIVTGNAVDARITLENFFESTEEVKEIPASFLTRGCVTQGQSNHAEGYDSELRQGHVIKERRVSSDLRGFSDIEVENRIRDAKKMELVAEEDYVKFVIPNSDKISAPVFLKSPNFVRRKKLTRKESQNNSSYISEDDETIENNLNPEYLKQLQSLPSAKDYSCQLDYSSETNKPVFDSKIYLGKTRIMGMRISAIQYTHISKGDIVCRDNSIKDAPSIKVGEGQVQSTSVRTNKIVGLGYNYCGGQDIYYAMVIKLNDGRIVSSFASRTESAPVVR